jgi:hypothetical protein
MGCFEAATSDQTGGVITKTSPSKNSNNASLTKCKCPWADKAGGDGDAKMSAIFIIVENYYKDRDLFMHKITHFRTSLSKKYDQ